MNNRDEFSDFAQPASAAEAMLAATLALMTGYAQVSTIEQRCVMAHKVCAALLELADDPDLSFDFRMALSALHSHWQLLVGERLERQDH